MKTVFVAFMLGDGFGPDSMLGICTDVYKAEKLIKTYHKNSSSSRLEDIGNSKFKDHGAHDGEDYHYFVEEVKTNKEL